MPPVEENPLRRLVRGMRNGQGVSFGTAWLGAGGTVLVLPVLRPAPSARRYILADEAKDGLMAVDTGRIDRIRVENTTAARVYVPAGVLFRGVGTASRGTVEGTLLEPGMSVDVDVRCVHPSHPIVAGSRLERSQVNPPARVYDALLARDQGRVWAAVAETLEDSRAGRAEGDGATQQPYDDLARFLEETPEDRDGSDDVHRTLPGPETQCGVIVLDDHGVRAVEVFDSHASWRVASRAILARIARDQPPTSGSPLRPNPDAKAITDCVQEFLGNVERDGHRWLTPSTWVSGPFLVQHATVGGEVIHLSVCRHEDAEGRRADGRLRAEHDAATGPMATGEAENGFVTGSPWAGRASQADGEVVAAASASLDLEDTEPAPSVPRERRRKVLTSGWDAPTFRALEHYSSKECGGDRSSAVRFLVRQGLRRRGYLSIPSMPAAGPALTPGLEAARSGPGLEEEERVAETRIHDLARIAEEAGYAGWLRERARAELERVASETVDDFQRSLAQSALDRLRPIPRAPEPQEPEPTETPLPTPTVDIRSLLGKALQASGTGKYPQALALFDEILEHEPLNRTALLGRAVALRRAGRAQEALEGLDRVLRLEPENAAALLNRGRILHERGNLAEALQAFDRLVAVAPNDWDVWMARGDVLMRLGRPRDALGSYGEALRRNPDDEKLNRKVRAAEFAARPVPTKTVAPNPLPFGVEEGQSYLVVERGGGTSYRVLRSLAERQLPSLVVTRQPPDRVRHEHDLAGAKVLGLSHATGPDLHDPTALASLARIIERFIEENHGRGVVLVEGLNRLIADNGFRDTILFVEHVNEAVLQRHAVFLVSVSPEGLAERELALLERNLKLLTEGLDLG